MAAGNKSKLLGLFEWPISNLSLIIYASPVDAVRETKFLVENFKKFVL